MGILWFYIDFTYTFKILFVIYKTLVEAIIGNINITHGCTSIGRTTIIATFRRV